MLDSPCGVCVMTRVHTHTRYPSATMADAVRKVLIRVVVEGAEMEHDSNHAAHRNVTRFK